MTKRSTLFVFLFLTVLLTACDPWKDDQIKQESLAAQRATYSEQYAKDKEQQRAHQYQLDLIEEQKAQMIQQRREMLEEDIRQVLNVLAPSMLVLCFLGGVVALYSMGRQAVVQINRVQEGWATAAIQLADIRSRLVYLDSKGQFPALVDGHVVTDLNTDTGMATDRPHRGDPLMITEANATRRTYLVSNNTRRSRDDAAPATALTGQAPQVIDGQATDVRAFIEAMRKDHAEVQDDD